MKRRYAVIGLALVVGFSTISPALGGPSPVATMAGGVKSLAKKALGQSKKAKRKARKAKRQAKRAKALAKQNAELIAQVEGIPGPKGDPGEDATNLFAYIRDPIDQGDPATVEYGNGVTGVAEDPTKVGRYTVTFNRSLANCVVQVEPGLGLPLGEGGALSNTAAANVNLSTGDDEDVQVSFYSPIADEDRDTSFLISAFC